MPDTDPALLLILASADPVRRGALVNARIEDISPDDTDPARMFFAGVAAGTVWSWDRSLPLLDASVNGLRRQGRLGLLVQALVTQAWAALHSSRIPAALSAADEAARLAPETGQGHWAHAARLVQALVTAAGGNADAADAHDTGVGVGVPGDWRHPQSGAGAVRTGPGRGRSTSGMPKGSRTCGGSSTRMTPPTIRTSARGGSPTWSRPRPTWATSAARGPTWASWSRWRRRRRVRCCSRRAAYARPLVADGDDAEQLYQAALADGLANWPDYRARMLLRYGEWLRRQRRTAESRAPLREARDSFDALGLASLAERARLELRASGESSSRREPRPWDELTPQELQIARMAADGMSNREIGQQLLHLAPDRQRPSVPGLPETGHHVPQPAARRDPVTAATPVPDVLIWTFFS